MTRPQDDTLTARAATYAGDHLEARGLTVLGAFVQTRFGVLPLVALDGSALVFASLRVSEPDGGFAPPIGAFNPETKHKLRLLAAAWLNQNAHDLPASSTFRFDALGVALDRHGDPASLDHVRSAY